MHVLPLEGLGDQYSLSPMQNGNSVGVLPIYGIGGLRYVYPLRLIGPISYPGECDLRVHTQKYSGIFSRMHFVTFVCI